MATKQRREQKKTLMIRLSSLLQWPKTGEPEQSFRNLECVSDKFPKYFVRYSVDFIINIKLLKGKMIEFQIGSLMKNELNKKKIKKFAEMDKKIDQKCSIILNDFI